MNSARIGAASVLECRLVLLQKPAVNAALRHGLSADGVPGHAVPQVNGVGEVIFLFVGVAEECLK